MIAQQINLIKMYIEKYKLNKWSIERNNINKGWRNNFFYLINKASGDLIFPCDQDDIWYPKKLKVMEGIMEKHHNIDLLVSNYKAFYDNGVEVIGPNENDGKLVKLKYPCFFFETPNPGCTYCIRKSFANAIIEYWDNNYPHDAFYWRYSSFIGSAYSINETLIRWRKHNDSTFTQESVLMRNYKERILWFDYAIQSLSSMLKYLNTFDILEDKEKKILLLNKNLKFIQLRKRFYIDKNLLLGIYLLKYMKFYLSFRRYVGDWYLVYIKR